MGTIRKQHHAFIIFLLVAVLCLTATSAVMAYDVTPSPVTTVRSGDIITLQINGLAATNVFTYRITSTDLDTLANTATFSNVNMPFGFTAGSATTTLTTTGLLGDATLDVVRLGDGSAVTLTGPSPITSHNNIRADHYDISITGTRNPGSNVGIDYSVTGTVAGPIVGAQILSFTVTNIDLGHLTIEIPGATPAFTQTFTIPAQEGSPGGSDSGGGGGAPAGGPTGPSAPVEVPALLAPPGITGTSVAIQHNEEGKALADYSIVTDPASGTSATVDISTGTTIVNGPGQPNAGQPVGEITVTPLDPATVTAATVDQSGVFSFSGMSVECEPTGAQFSGGTATISFSMTPAQWAQALVAVQGNTAALTIQTFDPVTNAWVSLETIVDPTTHTVSTQVTHFSMFALFYKTAEPAAPSPQTFGQLMTPTPTSTAVTSAPVTTPVKTMLAPPSTTPSPGIFDNIWDWIRQALGR